MLGTTQPGDRAKILLQIQIDERPELSGDSPFAAVKNLADEAIGVPRRFAVGYGASRHERRSAAAISQPIFMSDDRSQKQAGSWSEELSAPPARLFSAAWLKKRQWWACKVETQIERLQAVTRAAGADSTSMRKGDETGTAMPFKLDDKAYLRKSFDVARRAFSRGNHPFGALLVSDDAQLLLEFENEFLPDRDMTAHAERLLATAASKRFDPAFLRHCTLYASAEPCAMCAGAAYWAGIGRVVYALSERRLKAIIGDNLENPTLDLPCRTVFAAGQRSVEVVGPLLEEEAAALHVGVWDGRRIDARRL